MSDTRAPLNIRCDGCGWTEPVKTLRHFRAWYHCPCPTCGEGEVMNSREVAIMEALIDCEARGWVKATEGVAEDGWFSARINTANGGLWD